MREIKFRVWDTEEFYMYWDNIIIDCYCDGTWHYTVDHIANNEHNLIFMQYTNKRDVNYKEVYRNDIVRTDKGIGVIGWDYSFSCWEIRYSANSSDMLDVNFEVLGNIYENPELLEVDK